MFVCDSWKNNRTKLDSVAAESDNENATMCHLANAWAKLPSVQKSIYTQLAETHNKQIKPNRKRVSRRRPRNTDSNSNNNDEGGVETDTAMLENADGEDKGCDSHDDAETDAVVSEDADHRDNDNNNNNNNNNNSQEHDNEVETGHVEDDEVTGENDTVQDDEDSHESSDHE